MKKLITNMLILAVILMGLACNKEQPAPLSKRAGLSANQILKNEMRSTVVLKEEYTPKDIPLKVTYRKQEGGTPLEQAKRARISLKKLGFAGLAENRSAQLANRRAIQRKFDQLDAGSYMDDSSFELQSAIILRDLGLLQDTSREARTSVRKYLDRLLKMKSENIALEYFALKAIEKDLEETELQEYASRIVQINDTETDYRDAVKLKAAMLAKLDKDPDFMEKKGALTALQLWKMFNHIIVEHDYYQVKLKEVGNLK